MPSRLLDDEIFGRGKFADGDAGNGSVGLAAGGTLFLDQIGDMDLALQEKVLQAFKPDGRQEGLLDARVVCASTADPKISVAEGGASGRLAGGLVHRVRLLPLRDRKMDLPRLCEYLAEKFARNFGRPTPRLSQYVLETLEQWSWPGNIRELENWIARIVIFGTDEAIGLEFRRQTGQGECGGLKRRHPAGASLSHIRRARGRG